MIAKVAFNSPPARLFDYLIDEKDERWSASLIGCRVEVPFGRTTRCGYVVCVSEETAIPLTGIKKISRVIDPSPGPFRREHLAFAETLAERYLVSVGEILDLIYPIKLPAPTCPLAISSPDDNDLKSPPTASSRISLLCAVFNERLKAYKKIISETLLSDDASVLFILPTEEDVKYFAGYLSEFVPLVWDSSFKPRELADFYRRISSPTDTGKGHLIIGTRRASFLWPYRLKKIIVEREYDYGHKDGRSPYYSTRDVVLTKARFSDIDVVFGGLAFSLAVFKLFKTGVARLALGELPPQYYGKSDNDSVFSVETRTEFSKSDSMPQLLKDYLDGVYVRGGCAVIHSPRKSEKVIYYCRTCRKVIKCSKCGAPLVAAATSVDGSEFLKCPDCGSEQYKNETSSQNLHCPHCGSGKIYKKSSSGIDSIVKTLAEIYPAASISVVSSSVGGSRRSSYGQQIKAADFVVTTTPVQPWRVEKDIGATLIIDAGSDLVYPEYDATEKFFLNVAEYLDFSGGKSPIVLFPSGKAPSFVGDVSWWKNFYNFYDSESESRRTLGYPPFANIASITITAKKSPDMANRYAEEIIQDIKSIISSEKEEDFLNKSKIEILGDAGFSEKKRRPAKKYIRRVILKYEKLSVTLRDYLTTLPSERIRMEVVPSLTP